MGRLNELILKGIEDGRRAFIGPKIVQIDLTGNCNNNCIGCWVHSPYIKNPPRDKNITLPFAKVKELIKDLASLGTEEIYLSGAGEPLLHPHILEILELIKEKKMKINLITNFTLINKEIANRLVDLEVDLITASIWAGTPETYIKTHPGKTEEDFYRIKENLKNLSILKEKNDKHLPKIKIYNVICNLNYHEIHQMIDFALDTQVEFIEFQIMDIVENETSFLALSKEQIEKIKEQLHNLLKRNDLYFKELEIFKTSRIEELEEFPGRFLKIPPNFSIQESIKESDGKIGALHMLICSQGFHNTVSSFNPIIEEEKNRVIFSFPKEKCLDCSLFLTSCPIDKEGKINFKYLKVLSLGSFVRRINSSDIYGQLYEKEIIDKTPCYIGWTYSRILSTGEVIPCCKAVNKVLGNIKRRKFFIIRNRFSHIWKSKGYQKFRYKAKFSPKDNSYFKKINCYKSCDNVGMNLQIKELIEHPEIEILPKEVYKGEIDLPPADLKIIIPATRFKNGNLNPEKHEFGKGIVIDGGHGFGFADYEIDFDEEGNYELWACYASDFERPVELYFDKELLKKDALDGTTGGWTKEFLRWFKITNIEVRKGKHNLKIYTKGLIPHLYSFAFLKGVKSNFDLAENIYSRPLSLQLLKDKIKSIGLINSSIRLLRHIQSGKFINNYLDILGIFNGQYAFTGPFHVQIDLTNNCNNNCIGCWCNSPLLEEKRMPPKVKKQTLPFGLIKELLEELYRLGTKEIYFSGGGEPFMHPDIMEILEYAKNKGFICYVNTNFTLLNKEKIKRLVDIGLDHFTVSTWSATPKTYAITHPNKNEETFLQITENLKFLNRIKKKTPFIKLYNVIFNLNYHELKEMINFAKETGSESVEFTLIDTIPGKTDKLLLNSEQIKKLQNDAYEIAQKLDKKGYFDGVLLFRFDSFLRRISSSSDLSQATYDRNIIDKLPCYIGWCFSRIMPNGDVNACLKAHRIPVGNLYQESFKEIWNGEKQREFRKKTLVYEKKDPFFRLIGNDPDIKEAGCYKSCDDIGRNIYMHNRIMSLTPFERQLLKIISKIKQKPKLNLDSRDKNKDPIIQGILNGRRAFIGPEHVVIDITNRCNERCIGCWLYSPLLKNKPDIDWLKKELDFAKAKQLIDGLADLGTKRIRFTGGGEPFMHPKIMELIEYTKSKGLICCITTNFSLLNKEKIKKLIELEIDELAISLWASNERTYIKTHPGTKEGIFERIKENLVFLVTEKKEKSFVTLCNVICNLNYHEVYEMFEFAKEIGVDGIYFTLVDTLEGTEALLLNEKEKEDTLKECEAIKKSYQGFPKLDYFEGFICRLKEENSLIGNYDWERVNRIPCYVGWIFTRILADGSVSPCCRGVKKIMGNINSQNFKDIWFSQKYNEFRAKAKYLPKTDPYFSEIGCIKMCDNLMHNEEIHRRLCRT